MTPKSDDYVFRAVGCELDGQYVGLCAEFASLSWIAATPEAALRGIRQLVADVLSDLFMSREVIPVPIAQRACSGRIVIRLAPEAHARLALQAAEAGVSLGRLARLRLSQTQE